MSFIKKYGKGKGSSWNSSILGLSAEINKDNKDKTVIEIADKLAEQMKMVDGEIELESIEFRYRQANKEK